MTAPATKRKAPLAILLLAGLAVLTVPANLSSAARLHKEKDYQQKWCKLNGGSTEVLQQDKTRVDCLTQNYAIEFDFGSKWAEAIGQSLYYSIKTGKQPGIVLILEKKSDKRYLTRLNAVIREHGLNIKTWVMRPEDL